MRSRHRLLGLWAAGLRASLATSARAAALSAASVAAADLAAAAAAVATSDPAANAVHRHVPRALDGAWRPVRQQQVLPRWRRQCHWSELCVRHGLHGLWPALQDAAALAAALDAAALDAAALDAAAAVGHGVELADGAPGRLQGVSPPLARRAGAHGRSLRRRAGTGMQIYFLDLH